MINRENYEEKFLDYFEGNLSEQEVEELLRFIALNPDLENEFYLLIEQSNDICLTADDFSDVTLKRESKIGYELNTFEYLCVANLENDISKDEKILLSKSLVNPKLRSDFDLYQKVKVEPDDILYPFKEKLKKNVFKYNNKRSIASYSGIAAAVILVFYFAYYENNMVSRNNGSIVRVENPSQDSQQNEKNYSKLPNAISSSVALEDDLKVTTKRTVAEAKVKKNIAETSVDDKGYGSLSSTDDRNKLIADKLEGVQISKVLSTTEGVKELNVNSVEVSAIREKEGSSSDLHLAANVSSFLARAKSEGGELAETVKDTKGRKKGILIGRLISGVNAVLGTNMQYSSKYAADGKLIAVNFEAGAITYSKNYDDAE